MKGIFLLLLCIACIGFLKAQNVGIGISAPLGTLDVARGTAGSGTALFRGTDYASAFNYGTTEDTYIRGGKPFSHVIINDEFALGNVGIGTNSPLYKLHVAALGAGIVQSDGFRSIGTYTDVSGGWIGTFSSHPLHFFTGNGNQQMTLLTDGNVGIGTTSPQTKLHIHKNDEALRLSGVNPYLAFYNNSNVANSYIANSAGNLIIGTFGTVGEVSLRIDGQLGLVVQNDARVRVGALSAIHPVVGQLPKFSVHGVFALRQNTFEQTDEWALNPTGYLDFFFNGIHKAYVDLDGDWNSASDNRLKEDFQHYKSVLEGIKQLEVLTYHYKSDKTGKRSFGLVAQNVQEFFPEIVTESLSTPEKYLGIAYAKTGVLAIKAIQEQQVMIEELQKEIEELKKLVHKRDL